MIDATVTIVGAGPSGLTLAWWLVNQGVTVSVLEREAAIPQDMRASTFHPATLDLLDDSGLAELNKKGFQNWLGRPQCVPNSPARAPRPPPPGGPGAPPPPRPPPPHPPPPTTRGTA